MRVFSGLWKIFRDEILAINSLSMWFETELLTVTS